MATETIEEQRVFDLLKKGCDYWVFYGSANNPYE
jgi:hypothetical protein